MRKKSYPSSIKVRNRRYRVVLSPIIAENGLDDTNLRGWCDPQEKIILLRNTLSEKELFETFVHELLHAIEFEWKTEIPHALVYKLEGPLVQVLKTNFKLSFRRR